MVTHNNNNSVGLTHPDCPMLYLWCNSRANSKYSNSDLMFGWSVEQVPCFSHSWHLHTQHKFYLSRSYNARCKNNLLLLPKRGIYTGNSWIRTQQVWPLHGQLLIDALKARQIYPVLELFQLQNGNCSRNLFFSHLNFCWIKLPRGIAITRSFRVSFWRPE